MCGRYLKVICLEFLFMVSAALSCIFEEHQTIYQKEAFLLAVFFIFKFSVATLVSQPNTRFSIELNWMVLWGLAEKFIGWPRYFHRVWPKWGLFFYIVPLVGHTLLHSVLQCFNLIRIIKFINSRYDVIIWNFWSTFVISTSFYSSFYFYYTC